MMSRFVFLYSSYDYCYNVLFLLIRRNVVLLIYFFFFFAGLLSFFFTYLLIINSIYKGMLLNFDRKCLQNHT